MSDPGIATGGWMPEGFLTEAGPRPDFAEMFGAVEMPGGGNPDSSGGRTILQACAGFGKSIAPQDRGDWAGEWLTSGSIRRELFKTCRPHMVSTAAEKIKERICVK